MFVRVGFANVKSVEIKMLVAVNAPQFKVPVTKVGPVIVVCISLINKPLDPQVTT